MLSVLPSPTPRQTLEALRPLLWCWSRSSGLPVICGKRCVPRPHAHSSRHSAGGLSLLVIASTGQMCWGVSSPSLAAVLHRGLTWAGGHCLAPQAGQPRGIHAHSQSLQDIHAPAAHRGHLPGSMSFTVFFASLRYFQASWQHFLGSHPKHISCLGVLDKVLTKSKSDLCFRVSFSGNLNSDNRLRLK